MDLGHVVSMVSDLPRAVAELSGRGLAVEYGSATRPRNALAYFSQGPYLELLRDTGAPRLLGALASRSRSPRMQALARLSSWNRRSGLCALCLEGTRDELEAATAVLGGGLRTGSRSRTDPSGRTLSYEAFFPADPDLPFVMTHFSVDPRPRDFTHPGGARCISRIELPLPQAKQALVRSLCPDPALVLTPAGTPMRVTLDDGTTLGS